jgi:hypothetical protein
MENPGLKSETWANHLKGAPGTVWGEVLGIPHLKIEIWGTRLLFEGETRVRRCLGVGRR